ncbi:Cysteine and histidine-rich protein 1 [Orchesella cincta]|uniref:Cysteine and histidine-rich protein 1 n=1 Tax=Orchesella cincta TaxID=48709 RepID=A0A1D2MU66_ORCCI|nr:Cysteine and histidine-rich protein 1 [Orchesella cincta]
MADLEIPSGSQMLQQQQQQLPPPQPMRLEVEPSTSSSASTNAGSSSSSGAATPSSSSVTTVVVDVIATTAAVVDESLEPCKKKPRVDSGEKCQSPCKEQISKGVTTEKLEYRLGGILCCAVCLDLPKAAIYQCTNGHLMCAGCFTHLLADARLRDEVATCPNCRVEISKHQASRNLAVEKAVNELPSECQYCNKEYPRNTLDRHERELCEERTTRCMYHRIGCPWRGPYHEVQSHHESCSHPNKSGAEVMDILRVFDQDIEKEKKMYNSIFDLLSYENITFNDLQLKPYRTDEFVHKLYYETSRFSAFTNQWVVKARINNNQRDPTQSCQRQFTYQLILKTKPTTPLDISFVILKGPFGDMKLCPKIHQFEFTEQNNESPYFTLPLVDSGEANRLLSAKTIQFRLIAFRQ